MAWRTSQEAVEGILGDNYDTDGKPSLSPQITTANALTTEVVAVAARKNLTLSAALLQEVECWLAAHFYGHADQLYQEKKTADASAVFQGQTGKGLESTQYGQTAMLLDTTGSLRTINEGKRPGFAWLGKAPSSQTDYQDRN